MTPVYTEIDVMTPAFTKYRLYGPWNDGRHRFHLNLNRFTSADAPGSDFHDHPFAFRSIILYGGYTEQVLDEEWGIRYVERRPGDSFRVLAGHTHRIHRLHAEECWTTFLPEEQTQEVSFYRIHDGVIQKRAMGETWP